VIENQRTDTLSVTENGTTIASYSGRYKSGAYSVLRKRLMAIGFYDARDRIGVALEGRGLDENKNEKEAGE